MASSWVTGHAFPAVVGKNYEVAFGNVTYQQQPGMWTAKIHVAGAGPANWVDLDTGAAIDPALANFVVQAYREI
jgi:hypothetical protein